LETVAALFQPAEEIAQGARTDGAKMAWIKSWRNSLQCMCFPRFSPEKLAFAAGALTATPTI
jgi:metal-dependent amidase/aminoacylase/carboxypeptidase family protein